MTILAPRTDSATREGGSRRRGTGTAVSDRASRSKAAQRALDRRTRREGGGSKLPITGRRIAGMPIVVPILALVLGALALTLFLTTKAAQDSYAIDALRSENQELQARHDALKADVDAGDQAPALAAAAARQGMVPAANAAEIIVGPDGKARLRGTPAAATGKALPDLNPTPDPVDKIDKNKVDDSVGLGGDQAPGSTADPAPAPQPQVPAPAAPSNEAPATSTPAPNPRPSVAPAPTANPKPARPDSRSRVSQNTNVLPMDPATPRGNTAPAR
ncbi:MAG: hypothetical protein WBA98_09685 [Gordonia sp. (in: high G+C Gram-positive bacteria)]|uniref:hypothetical protein n=1 Tax=Gordonia sp. (in: high G+C Gram-positive bacteria) TaxID=84139 RepID=UPI003C77F820